MQNCPLELTQIASVMNFDARIAKLTGLTADIFIPKTATVKSAWIKAWV